MRIRQAKVSTDHEIRPSWSDSSQKSRPEYGIHITRTNWIPGRFAETHGRGDYWMLDLRYGVHRRQFYREHNWLDVSKLPHRQVGFVFRETGLFATRWNLVLKAWTKLYSIGPKP